MNIDIDDIESRINEGIYGDDRMTATGRDDAFSALAALLAEVERLRGEVSYLRACVPPTRPTDYGHEVWAAALRAEVAAERAAVVAYLREAATKWGWGAPGAATALNHAADIIERGEHRRKEEP
jgi:hypothetical protein